MTNQRFFIFLLISLFVLMHLGFSQNSGRIYRRSGVLNGNQVKTVFGNWGVIGQPSSGGPRGAWIFDTNGYIGDVSPLVGAEVVGKHEVNGNVRDTTFFWVIDCPAARQANPDLDKDSNRQAFEPVAGYFNESGNNPAISSRPETWPLNWPDKDPSWDGAWNGLFGKKPNADMETFFVMDDNNDNEYNIPTENEETGIWFSPDSTDPTRQGMGLEMKVRGLQWQQILAQDNIFWVYEIKNQGTTNYNRTVFGMIVGTYVGVTGTDDSPGESDDDWSFFNVNEDLTWTGDYPNDNSRNPFWEGAVGLVGYAFLESPGNPFDGIDNDNDADNGQTMATAPFFTEDDFQEVTFSNNPTPNSNETDNIILINPQTYERILLTFPTNTDTFVIDTLGYSLSLYSGITTLSEGNVINQAEVEAVNVNAYDGKDNDLDGIIDENYFLHYRQRRITGANVVLFDILNPVRHVDYVSSTGLSDEMIDERRDDEIDNDGDWSRNPETGEFLYDDDGNLLDDYGEDGLPNTNDPGEYDGIPSPGEPNFDQTDKDESDQIGLSSFEYFAPSNTIELGDDNGMWKRLRPGFFDVPETIRNGRPIGGEDGDFVYGSGYFPLTAGQTERMSLALIYAWDIEEMIKKLEVVRKIYNSDYRFPIAPDKPKLTAVPGDNKVTLYWDRAGEFSFDPVLRDFDFEGYKIYRSTDPNFNDVRVVTNSSGNVVSYKELVSFDLIDDIFGWYYPPYDIYQILQGWSYNLGDETGLQHSYVDNDVENGRTYYYAVVSYDQGVDTAGVIPSECTKSITQTPTGEIILDPNTAMIMPGKPSAGYTAPEEFDEVEHVAGDGFGTISYEILDPTALTGHEYDVYFWDTSNDGIDNNNNWDFSTDDLGADGIAGTGDEGEGDGKPTRGEPNIDENDNIELEAITTSYAVRDNFEYKEEFTPEDTNFVILNRKNLIEESIIVQDGIGNIIADSLYEINVSEGKIRAAKSGVFNSIIPSITYQYHPIYFSEYIQGNPKISSRVNDTDIFDGITLDFENIWKLAKADTGTSSQWNTSGINYRTDIGFTPVTFPDGTVRDPISIPANYELRISNNVVDSTSGLFAQYGFPSVPSKFEIFNTTGGYNIEYMHFDTQVTDSLPSSLERIIFFEKDTEGEFNIYTWQFQLVHNDTNPPYQFQGGEVLALTAKFPFNKFDQFKFKTDIPTVDNALAESDLDKINVYPNPYIVAHAFEPALPPNITSGRGERRVYFTNIPRNAKIFIFTARGDHVITLENDDNIFDGTVIWNLKTKENLDIAYGVYFYVVDSSVGKKRGKLAVIK